MRKDAFGVVVDALARRDLTSAELEERLSRAGYEPDACADAIARAAAAGYVDDDRVALERARRLAERGASNEAIRMQLIRRGTSDAAATSALDLLGQETERAELLAEKLGGGLRAARALERKGYPEDVIERVLRVDIAE